MSQTLYEKSTLTLELPQVLEKIAAYAVSDGAKAMLLAMRPYTYLDDIRAKMREITDALALMRTRSAPMFSGLSDVTVQLRRVEIGGSLSPGELLKICDLLRCARATQEYGDPDARRDGLRTCLDARFRALHINRTLENLISGSVLNEDELADSASPELASIRRHIRQANARVREVLQRIISSPAYSRSLQEALITQRGGRFVVPVKAEYRADIRGLVHDVSASGATLFIEPEQVVEANNEIRLLGAKEEKEVERILAALSAEVGSCAGAIEDNVHNLCYLDAVFAKAQYSRATDAFEPQLSEGLVIDLRRARHPLLDPHKAVPIDIRVGGDFDTLVITGPNTGGKTVALKTIGLLTLMAQCGLHIPASEESTVSLFTRIFADIGDEQSISQSLSTFSSHMVNIVGVLEQLDDRSLVLFDELGAGTDPTEGAALATAIIEHCRSQGARLVATTHYAELKMYALTEKGVENAACEFDLETLRPTYRLLIGVPGKSNAFAISKRLGLDERIIEAARRSLSGESIKFEDVISDLEGKRQAMEKELAVAASARLESEKRARETEKKQLDTQRESVKELERARREAQKIISDAKAVTEATYRELAELKKRAAAEKFAMDIAASRAETERTLNEASRRANPELPQTRFAPQRPLKVGDIVAIGISGTRAEVLTAPDKNGQVTLQAGIMTIQAKADTLRLLEEETKASKVKFTPAGQPSGAYAISSHTRSAVTTLDIRGMASDEAMIELQRFIDSAQLAHLSPVTIIHGKGSGVLRQAVGAYLKKDRRIASFRPGKYGEGEAGVTVAELKGV